MGSSFSTRLARAMRHWRTTAAVGRKAFPTESLGDLGAAITEGELHHRGEVRLIVENSMPFDAVWNDVSNRQRALALFAEFGVWDTEDNCGVLIYVNLAEHKVEIVCDRNIGRRIDSATWQAICQTMTQGFRRGEFHDSTLAAIHQVNQLLRQHFPAEGEAVNELPDHPIVL
ncbi:TPM domain-containing protein [Massilia soli]|uniref:TPM domain-containing protein n=1 Tax=Massilia soli TaxID=2792854 RepID=A0ABS7SKC5_9BURK|nr:TPM domain-containing protein [Massilia soli]MBZ2206646.1 TPM domain-containing protein [Massilia soli]